MENRRSTPVVVWIPDKKAYLVADAEELCYTTSAIQAIELWARETDLRIYVAQNEIKDDNGVRPMADITNTVKPGED